MTFRIGPTPLVTLSRRTLLRGPGLRAPMLLIRSGEVEGPLPGSRTTHGVVHVGDEVRRPPSTSIIECFSLDAIFKSSATTRGASGAKHGAGTLALRRLQQ
jgi:hypothetical protein